MRLGEVCYLFCFCLGIRSVNTFDSAAVCVCASLAMVCYSVVQYVACLLRAVLARVFVCLSCLASGLRARAGVSCVVQHCRKSYTNMRKTYRRCNVLYMGVFQT